MIVAEKINDLIYGHLLSGTGMQKISQLAHKHKENTTLTIISTRSVCLMIRAG